MRLFPSMQPASPGAGPLGQADDDDDLFPGEDQDEDEAAEDDVTEEAEADEEYPVRLRYARGSVRWRRGEAVVFTEPLE